MVTKMFKYKVMANVEQWVGNDMIEEWDAEDIVIAEDEIDARDILNEGIKEYYGDIDCELVVHNVTCEELGPADVFIHTVKERYHHDMDTITVGELIDYLMDNFDDNSEVYLARYSWSGYNYSGIEKLKIGYIDKE